MRDVDCGRDPAGVMLPLGGAVKVKPRSLRVERDFSFKGGRR